MLGEFGDEIQGVEDLEVACDPRTAAEQIGARRPGEASAGFLLGEVDHGALLGDAAIMPGVTSRRSRTAR